MTARRFSGFIADRYHVQKTVTIRNNDIGWPASFRAAQFPAISPVPVIGQSGGYAGALRKLMLLVNPA
jgi:hypothetical protein